MTGNVHFGVSAMQVQGQLDLADVTYVAPPEGWVLEEVEATPDPTDVFDLDMGAGE